MPASHRALSAPQPAPSAPQPAPQSASQRALDPAVSFAAALQAHQAQAWPLYQRDRGAAQHKPAGKKGRPCRPAGRPSSTRLHATTLEVSCEMLLMAFLFIISLLPVITASPYKMSVGGTPAQTFNLTLLSDAATSEGAVCLDGSPAAFYWSPGAETTKFYLHQEGGGWCGSDSDCFGRSKTRLGSSKSYTKTITMTGGYFDNDPVRLCPTPSL